MDINGPFSNLPLDLSCIEKALRLNDLQYLHTLFDESELILVTSNEVLWFSGPLLGWGIGIFFHG